MKQKLQSKIKTSDLDIKFDFSAKTGKECINHMERECFETLYQIHGLNDPKGLEQEVFEERKLGTLGVLDNIFFSGVAKAKQLSNSKAELKRVKKIVDMGELEKSKIGAEKKLKVLENKK